MVMTSPECETWGVSRVTLGILSVLVLEEAAIPS